MSDALKARAEEAIYILRNGGDDDPVIDEVGPESEGPYDLDLWMADCHVATIHPNEGQTDFSLAECIRDSGKLIQDLLTERDATMAEADGYTRLRIECVGSLTDAGIFMLAAPHDPTAPGEVPSAIKRLAQQRDSALAEAKRSDLAYQAICEALDGKVAEAAAHKAEAEILRGLLDRIARHGPIMGSRGDYRQAQLEILESVRAIAAESLAATPTAKES